MPGSPSADIPPAGSDQPYYKGGPDKTDLDRLVQLTGQLYAAALTEQTRASYARRWNEFTDWCQSNQLRSLPATPEASMMYLAEGASLGYSVTTLRGRAAAINRVHVEAGEPAPGANPSSRLFWKGLARTLPAPRALEITALRIVGLREICRVIDANAVDPVEVRDRAILGLFSVGVTGPEIARLRWSEVDLERAHAVVTVLAVRGTGVSRRLTAHPADPPAACPVAALASWRDHVMTRRGECIGPVFCHFDPRCEQGRPLTGKIVNEVRRQRRKTLGDGVSPASLQRAMEMLGDLTRSTSGTRPCSPWDLPVVPRPRAALVPRARDPRGRTPRSSARSRPSAPCRPGAAAAGRDARQQHSPGRARGPPPPASAGRPVADAISSIDRAV